jgi:lipopolysaccharide export system protein LptA
MTALVIFSPSVLQAQLQDGCVFGDGGNDVYQRVALPGGETIHYVTNPYFECGDGVSIWADSAVAYSASSMTHLLGSVRYLDQTRELRSDEARYFSNVGRLQAQGHVFVEDLEDGSVIEDGDLIYLRQTDFRPEETMTVTVAADGIRPTATLTVQPTDTSAAPADSAQPQYVVIGDEIVFRGESDFSSKGRVEIRQDSLLAFADSARYDRATDQLLLRGSARVEQADYDLVGRSIDVLSPGGAQSEIRAMEDATLTSSEIELFSPQIFMHLSGGELQRLVAVPMPPDSASESDSAAVTRPVAVTEEFELVADSLEVNAPGEELERVFAAGSARSVSSSRDSLNIEGLPEIARTDWIEGDTIIFVFTASQADSLAPHEGADSLGSQNQIEKIVAKRAARSLYRIPPSDGEARAGVDPPSVHYVIGDQITLLMSAGDVEHMEVIGQTRGVHLEPFPVTQRADPASSVSPQQGADSIPVPVDTTGTAHLPASTVSPLTGLASLRLTGGCLPDRVPAPAEPPWRQGPRRPR